MGTLFRLENCDMPHDLDPDAESPSVDRDVGRLSKLDSERLSESLETNFGFRLLRTASRTRPRAGAQGKHNYTRQRPHGDCELGTPTFSSAARM